ncbi:MFS transporter [Streptomyces sp. NPDC004542]|uniref:MFS transporter n=1 Tax=Streptomyces sp. NPDC004542 TaxID=3154281 RepID=UPI0033BFB148
MNEAGGTGTAVPSAAATRSAGPVFRRLWTATVVSSAGDGARLIALPLLAARISDDPIAVTSTTMAASLPWLVCSMLSGALVDRFDRWRLMRGANACQAVVMTGFALAVFTHHVGLLALIAVAFVTASLQTVVDLSAQALLPAVTGKEQLAAANGRLQAGTRIAGLLAGPALGGLLFTQGPAVPFVLDALSFVLSTACVWAVPAGLPRSPAPGLSSGRGRIREGMRWLLGHRLLRTLCLGLLLWSLADTAVVALLPLYAMDSLGLPDSGVGILLTTSAIGGFAGSLAAPRIAPRTSTPVVVTGVFALTAIGYAILAGAARLPTAAVALLCLGFSSGVWVVVVTAVRQSEIPSQLLGRVSSAYRMVGFGSRPAGAALGGLLAHTWSLTTAFWSAAAVMTVTAVAVGPALAHATRPDASNQASDKHGAHQLD